MSSHALMLEYGNTRRGNHSVVLIVLREPNTKNTECNGQLGLYDFREYPRCAAWNIAYGLIAHYIGLNTPTFKNKCEELGASPILFTDASTIGIQNIVADKYSQRRAVGVEAEQGDRIFSLLEEHDLQKRVRLILLSGLSNEVFKPVVERLDDLATERRIPLINVPFLYGTNVPEIRRALEPVGAHILAEVGQEFINAR